ncbi:electron transport complex subunit RsxC [Enterococcus nangangensis]|uniref:electron transport complex subunit RsxC n=1 Tax=Enterococcus nangangensis TaxID=2559926 RepID=UPI0010F98437|nr:electron transport complex subunit RsxC [Enterococcus nangangensis]
MVAKKIQGTGFSPALLAQKKAWHLTGATIEALPSPHVFIPLHQHIGAPTSSVVKIGDTVQKGQLLGASEQFVSANVHASVSGKIVDEILWPDSNNQQSTVLVVENDFQEETCYGTTPDMWTELPNEEILQRIQNAGIVGKGGATFPTHIKLSVPYGSLTTLVINGAECEPFLQSDDYLMQQSAPEIITSAKIVEKLIGVEKIVVGIEEDKPEALSAMKKASASWPNFSVVPLPVFYPEGGEKQLIKALLNQEVPLGALPSALGVIVLNVATLFAIYEAVTLKKPLVERITTVTGNVAQPKIFRVPLGTPVGALIDACGGLDVDVNQVLLGGPMMGRSISSLAVPITKGTNGVVALNARLNPATTETPCIRCNRCVVECPMGLMPLLLDHYYRKGDFQRLAQLQVEACINCGVCTYTCPAKRDLASNITKAKGIVAQLRKEAESDGKK